MNKPAYVVTMIAMLLTTNGWAQESDTVQGGTDPGAVEQANRQIRLDYLMDTMAKEMVSIRKTRGRIERQALMTAHQQKMREAMDLIRSMAGVHMREVMREHLDAAGNNQEIESDRAQHRHKQIPSIRPRTELTDAQRLSDLENRLDMMQVIVESLLDEYSR